MTVRTFYPPNANVNALTICNACDSRPMLPSQEAPSAPGYCQECLDEATIAAAATLETIVRLVAEPAKIQPSKQFPTATKRDVTP